MQIKDLYNKTDKFDNIIYSIDKIRLKTYITRSEFQDFEYFIRNFYNKNIKKFWISDRPMCFHYNYDIDMGEFSFYFGFQHNNKKKSSDYIDITYNFTIEFNPNKAKDNVLILSILDKYDNWYLRSFDLAMDIPINILDIIVDISGRRKIQTFSLGCDNLTYNYGKGDGRVKIYNKKRESDLSITGHLTRVEVTKEFEDFPISNLKKFQFDEDFFPCLYLNQYVFSFSDYNIKDKTLMAILYAVQSGYPIKDLSRSYKEKLKKMLDGGSKIKFNRKSVVSVFNQTILFYFYRRTSKQVIF